jgi:hypothetical protein
MTTKKAPRSATKTAAEAEAEADAKADAEAEAENDEVPTAPAADADEATAADDTSTPTSAEYTVAFSPRQVAVGLAIVAGLVAIAVRRRKGRDRKGVDD